MINLLLHAGAAGHLHGYDFVWIALAVVGALAIWAQREDTHGG